MRGGGAVVDTDIENLSGARDALTLLAADLRKQIKIDLDLNLGTRGPNYQGC